MSEHPEWANLMMAARKQFQLLKDFNPHAKSEVWARSYCTWQRGWAAGTQAHQHPQPDNSGPILAAN